MRRPVRGSVVATLVLVGSIAVVPRRASAHVDYVTDPPTATRDAVEFASEVLADPLNAALVGGGTLAALVALTAAVAVRPTIPDVEALRGALAEYDEYIPWMLRLSLGLPLIGAGFGGYLFSPAVQAEARLFQVALGFLILSGLATRLVAAVGLVAYLLALAVDPALVLAVEYVPGFAALVLVGSGRPSADHMLQQVATTEGTYYGRVDPVYGVTERFTDATAPYERYVPTVLRAGIGVSFVYLGLVEKLANPSRAVQVVDKYDLTAVVPVDAGLWVLGAGLTEIGVGFLLLAGLYTRAAAGTAFLMLVLTLFGLPDDPVLAHVTLFGMLSAVFTLGSGPLALDAWFRAQTDPGADTSPSPSGLD